MGMAASQARFLNLTARKTNIEFEGAQINQQRTALSNESANYYSQLASMSVPVPPSTEDYTKITYTFEDGSEKNTVTSIVATKTTKNDDIYMLNYVQEIPSSNMVVNGTNVISKSNGGYFIGKVQLQNAINLDGTKEVDGEQQHEHGCDILFIRTVGHVGIILYAEAAGTGCTEGMTA